MSDTTEKPVSPLPESMSAPRFTLPTLYDEDLTSVGSLEYHSGVSSPRSTVAKNDIDGNRDSSAVEDETPSSPSRGEKGQEAEHNIVETEECSSSSAHEYHAATVEDTEDEEERPVTPVAETSEYASSSSSSVSSDNGCEHCRHFYHGSASGQSPGSAPRKQRSNQRNHTESQIQPEYERCVWHPVSDYLPPRVPSPNSWSAPIISPYGLPLVLDLPFRSLVAGPSHTYCQTHNPLRPELMDLPHDYRSQNATRSSEPFLTSSFQNEPSSSRPSRRHQKEPRHERTRHGEPASTRKEQEDEQFLDRLADKVQRVVDARINRVQEWGDEILTFAEGRIERRGRKREALRRNDGEALLREHASIHEDACISQERFLAEDARLQEEFRFEADHFIAIQEALLQEEDRLFDLSDHLHRGRRGAFSESSDTGKGKGKGKGKFK